MFDPKPFNEGFLPEEDGHTIYYAEYGNPNGEVIVTLHGGPGAQSKPSHVMAYDLEVYRVVAFDQRGCGKSTPSASVVQNTTQKLISDIERLREHLGIKNWFVAGGSWGSTLALVYAETHPDKVRGLMLCLIFLGDDASIRWAFSEKNGVAEIYSDVWDERERFLEKYNTSSTNAARDLSELLISSNEETQKDIVANTMNWEGNLLTAGKDVHLMRPEDVTQAEINYATTYLHYEANHFFLKENQIMNNLSNISNIPMIIVHGRHDVLCPFIGAWKLHTSHTLSKLVTLPQSNHMLTADGFVARYYAFDSFLKDHR